MRCAVCSLCTALLICAALSGTAALGQSLSIVKKAESEYWIEASAPVNNPRALQASGNLHLWVDIHDDVQARYSVQFDTAGVAQRYFRLIPSTPPAPPIRVLLLGDSMTQDGSGWGGGVYGYFKPNATVVNYGTAWASTKVFLQSAEFEKMLLIKPNYVLMQYGFMDSATTDTNLATTLEEYADNLRTIVQTVRGFNGVPILITLYSARLFDAQGKVVPLWQERNNITKQVAAELNTPLIDLNQLSRDLLNELGPSGSTFMNLFPDDLMHLSPLGAQYYARLVVNALPDSLGPYLTGIFDPPPKP
jgi:lysophospholipase L1-like esterase